MSPILLVDDEVEVRRLACTILQRGGYEVIAAATPAEAIEFAHTDAPIDLLVADFILPKMSGATMASAIRERRPLLPVLFISGYPLEPPVGVSAFLRKPFEPHELLAAARSLLDRVVHG